MGTRILHVDMDSFFVSVELVEHPEYQGKPVAVVTKVDSPRGVVSSASYEARYYGVTAGMSIGEVRRRCPNITLIAGVYEKYVYVSEKVVSLLHQFSPSVEVASIDESFLDITGCVGLFGSEERLALRLKKEIHEKLGLPCTVGIASTYIVSKIAVKQKKPNGYCSVTSGKELEFLSPLPIRSIPGIGSHAEEIFHSLGVYTVGQLQKFSLVQLEQIFGKPYAFHLFQWARGRDVEWSPRFDMPRVISREITFENDLIYWREITPRVVRLLEACTYELRQKGMEARRLTLKVRYADFITPTFSYSFFEPTFSDAKFLSALFVLLTKAQTRKYRVRLVGVMLSELRPINEQLELFYSSDEIKEKRRLRSIDKIRERYGFSSICHASALQE
ncbi:MAG: DNA polymerase IV [Candidatus Hydrogenedens sp.]|nr:DNA polymerase IV [Candidatus Hydrogenedens sp.]